MVACTTGAARRHAQRETRVMESTRASRGTPRVEPSRILSSSDFLPSLIFRVVRVRGPPSCARSVAFRALRQAARIIGGCVLRSCSALTSPQVISLMQPRDTRLRFLNHRRVPMLSIMRAMRLLLHVERRGAIATRRLQPAQDRSSTNAKASRSGLPLIGARPRLLWTPVRFLSAALNSWRSMRSLGFLVTCPGVVSGRLPPKMGTPPFRNSSSSTHPASPRRRRSRSQGALWGRRPARRRRVWPYFRVEERRFWGRARRRGLAPSLQLGPAPASAARARRAELGRSSARSATTHGGASKN